MLNMPNLLIEDSILGLISPWNQHWKLCRKGTICYSDLMIYTKTLCEEQFWTVCHALESIIHGALEFCLVLWRLAEKEIPFWAREKDGLTDILVEENLYKCSNCSLVKESDPEFPFCSMFSPFEAWTARPSPYVCLFQLVSLSRSFQ